ncbi:MAG: NAD-dependent protein deacylase, partial [candidate division NC10 bacterium]|nr:NAD-dependent protein deacylase [candidate division NC10 bacterium]
ENFEAPLQDIPPRCKCGGLLRPDVVWFGEALPADALRRAFDATESSDVFLVVGTSALVHPAASLPRVAREHGAYVVEVNLEPTPLTSIAHESHHGKAGEILPRLLGFDSAIGYPLGDPQSAIPDDPQPPAPHPHRSPCSP